MANLGATSNKVSLHGPILFIILEKSALEGEEVHHIEEDWHTPINEYLTDGTLPSDRTEARKVRVRAAKFCLIEGELYKHFMNGPLLRCLGKQEAHATLEDLHNGHAGGHAGGRSLAFRAYRVGYFWPTMKEDAIQLTRSCDKYQRFATNQHSHPEP